MSSLAGLGKSGAWHVDIDNEEGSDHQYNWSITLSHPSCHIQWGISDLTTIESLAHHLSSNDPPEVLHKIPGLFGVDILFGIIEEQLIIQSREYNHSSSPSFNWLMEFSLPVSEVKDLVAAIREAMNDAA